MTETDAQIDFLNQRNLQVLQSYADRHCAAAAADRDHDGWLERIASTEELNADQLTRVHGELIALGMLRFELSSREIGLRYQISELGHQTLSRQLSGSSPDTNSVDPGDGDHAPRCEYHDRPAAA